MMHRSDMPINYKHYHPKWSLISRLIRNKRAHNKCELCGVKNRYIIERNKDNPARWRYVSWHERMELQDEIRNGSWSERKILKEWGWTKIVLTVAHMDHDKSNNRFSNLKALCQRCHLVHDIKHHVANRKYGRYHKVNQLSLFTNTI